MLTTADIVKATGGELISGTGDKNITDINTDTRVIKEGKDCYKEVKEQVKNLTARFPLDY